MNIKKKMSGDKQIIKKTNIAEIPESNVNKIVQYQTNVKIIVVILLILVSRPIFGLNLYYNFEIDEETDLKNLI